VDRRISYEKASLDEANVCADPREQFQAWLAQASETQTILEPNAMALATAGPDGRPHARMVLLRGSDERGYVFFTNYESAKGEQLAANGRCALLFYWAPLERQVRIEGRAEILEAHGSDAYFRSRPPGHRLGAWISPQSKVIPDRAFLESRAEAAQASSGERYLERPGFWGGYRVVPDSYEFWQGRADRLHDRIRYRREGEAWIVERLGP
jgi:pyridoxamine 5'-phosphate oxidase